MALGITGAKALTTTPAALLSSSSHRSKRMVLVKAHGDNTADVAIGFVNTVECDKTDATNCGLILGPGDQVPIAINESVDEDDERTIYGVAASGTQYVTIICQ